MVVNVEATARLRPRLSENGRRAAPSEPRGANTEPPARVERPAGNRPRRHLGRGSFDERTYAHPIVTL